MGDARSDLRRWILLCESDQVTNAVMRELSAQGWENPADCNDGYCGHFADGVVRELGRGRVVSTDEIDIGPHPGGRHEWVYVDGRHYDSETPYGVDDPRDLGYFRRHDGREMPPTPWEPDILESMTVQAFHGTKRDFDAFDLGKFGTANTTRGEAAVSAIWAAENPQVASAYAGADVHGNSPPGALVMPIRIHMENPLIVDMNTESPRLGSDAYFEHPTGRLWDINPLKQYFLSLARDRGHDGVIFKNGYDGWMARGDLYAVFNPKQITMRHQHAEMKPGPNTLPEARAPKREIDIEKAEFPALVKHAQQVVLKGLVKLGIPDRFTVKIKGGTTSRFDQQWVGMYRGETQFRGHGAIFWINANLPKIVADDHDPNYDGSLASAMVRNIVITLFHEYAHVIEEYARYHPDHVPELGQLINASFPDREDFAEEFGRYFGGSISHADMETFGPIIQAWIKVLTEETPPLSEAAAGRRRSYYHVTLTKNLPGIQQQGLVPSRGPLSLLAGESRAAIYLFPNLGAVEEGVMNWMGDYLPDDEPLALLKVALPIGMRPRRGENEFGYEFIVYQPIPPENLEVLTSDLDTFVFD